MAFGDHLALINSDRKAPSLTGINGPKSGYGAEEATSDDASASTTPAT